VLALGALGALAAPPGGPGGRCIAPGWRDPSFVQLNGPVAQNASWNPVCSPWAASSCCTASYAQALGTRGVAGIYPGFSFNQCPQVRPVSATCLAFHNAEECFYSCDPYTAPYEDPTTPGSIVNVPLCADFCNAWFNACASDFTCSDNWNAWFPNETTGLYTCPGECRPYGAPVVVNGTTRLPYFSSATDFCTRLYTGSFTVAAASVRAPRCFSASWTGSNNPNNPNGTGGTPAAGAPAGGSASVCAAAALALAAAGGVAAALA